MNTIIYEQQNSIKVFFDYNSDSCIWDSRTDYKYNPNPTDLTTIYKVHPQTALLCGFLARMFNFTINWKSPNDYILLDPGFIKIFIDMENYVYKKLLDEVGDKYEFEYLPSWIKNRYDGNLPTEQVKNIEGLPNRPAYLDEN